MTWTKLMFAAASVSAIIESSPAKAAMTTKPDGGLTFASVVLMCGVFGSIITVVGVGIAIYRAIRTTKRENEADAQSRTDRVTAAIDTLKTQLETRVTTLETRVERFVPGDVIDQKVEHLKANRMAAEGAINNKVDGVCKEVSEMRVHMGQLEERGAGMAAAQVEIKEMVRELGREMKAGFEKIAEKRAA